MADSNKKIVAVVLVRMGASRFPGKVMKEILGKPVLGYLLERVKRSELINDIVVATSINRENDVIEEYCNENDFACFRGSEEDVLGRSLGALKSVNADVGVEIFGDGPLIDPKIIDHIVQVYLENEDKYDFVSNDLETTYPPGMELEVYSVKSLEDADKSTLDLAIREHGTLFIRQNPNVYRLFNIKAPEELNFPELEMELDTKEDFLVLENIINNVY
ncbi:MAG: glycosyltransferase family protein, partial [Candidatus Omnitrophica bacterium]|nr:glycosyltransferase family protein [Candidatus Omnitrophota bacterium]